MLLSVFTPSHRPDGLGDVYRCLLEQSHADWEWVVLANGPSQRHVGAVLPMDDPRVHVHYSDAQGVGALKREACGICRGDVLVEVDHDDLLTPDCLEAVASAAKTAPTNSFIYSDAVTCRADGSSDCFDPGYGWEQYDWEGYRVNRGHPINPRSLCEILYSPDHVRAWTRVAYERAGGHDASLPVGDDHELLVRTYLAGAEFVHIPRPLYLHRLNPTTTSQQRLEEIGQQSWATRDKYLHQLVGEWCRRESLPMYDLGGRHGCPPGYLPVDRDPAVLNLPGGVRYDVLNGFPARDGSVGCFRCADFLEHVPVGQVTALLNCLWRKLVPGGWLLTSTPAICDDEGRCGRGAFQDPTHVSYWSSNNTWYFSKREFAKYDPSIECRFQTVRLSNGYPSAWHRTHLIPYLTWDACALKDGLDYWPGPKEI